MKLKLLTLCLFCSLFSFGQMQDLAKLADGNQIFNTVLFDSSENLYGYFYIYQIDTKNKKTVQYEYVVLDKNLNKVNNGTFEGPAKTIFIEPKFNDCTLMGDNLILDKLYLNNAQGPAQTYLNTVQIISLKNNTVSAEKQFINKEFVDADTYHLKSLKLAFAQKIYSISAYSNTFNSGFFVTDILNFKEISFFDSNFKKQWTYTINGKDSLNVEHSNFALKLLKDNAIYATEQSYDKIRKAITYKILAIDFTTGIKKYDYEINSSKDKLYHTYESFKVIDNKLVLVGHYNTNIGYFDFRSYYKGLYKIMLDENGKEIEKSYHPWSDFNSKIKLSHKGRVKNNYYLINKNSFVFQDGTVSILNEMYKPQKNPLWFVPIIGWFTSSPERTKNFLVFNFDNKFNLNKVDTIRKDVTYDNETDYLFSQTLKKNNGVVFFHTNNMKDAKTHKKNYMLGINSIIDGKLNQELIPLYQKKKYVITPMPAKEGYIMLREYNEKDKYNQIRLEKLNY
ncbi:MAG: hypothetical protein PHT07_22600 [Paludibacter sp.]|nr:hypothetical protein [Paludibacter sp.]